MADGGEDDVGGITVAAFEVASAEVAVALSCGRSRARWRIAAGARVWDVARANVIGAKAKVTDEVFNVGSGFFETSLAQLATALAFVMGRRGMTPEFAPEPLVNPVPRRLASIGKAERCVGLATK